MLNRYIKANRSDFWSFPLFMGIMFLVMEVIFTIIVVGFHEHSAPLVGGAVTMFAGMIYLLLAMVGLITTYFDIFLSFGRTRKQALGLVIRLAAIYTALCSVISILLLKLEKLLLPGIWAQLGGFSEVQFGSLSLPEGSTFPAGLLMVDPIPLPWWIVPLLFVGVALISFVAAALVRCFGGKAGWTLYLIFIIGMLSFNHLNPLLHQLLPILVLGLIVFLVAGLIWSVRFLLHTPYKS